jgi:hypothetical protein
MTATQSIHIRSVERGPELGAGRIRNRRRSTAPPTVRRDHAGAPGSQSPDRADANRRAAGAGAGQILRRWSVTDLIARAGGAPRAFA